MRFQYCLQNLLYISYNYTSGQVYYKYLKMAAPAQLTEDQIRELRQAFDVFDYDHAGVISSKKMGEVMRSLGQNPTEAEIYDLVDEIDIDGNGEIDFLEFLQMMATKYPATNSDEDLIEAFKIFDSNDNGVITSNELRRIMQNLGERLTDEEIEDIMREVDTDRDGVISFEEFKNAMRS